VLHPEKLAQAKRDSIAFVQKHHHNLKVAERYVELWGKLKVEN